MVADNEFKNLCKLARLNPVDESLSDLKHDFNRIIEYVNKINEVDTSQIEDTISKSDTRNTSRKDEAKDTLSLQTIKSISPLWESGHFVVPAVIDAE